MTTGTFDTKPYDTEPYHGKFPKSRHSRVVLEIALPKAILHTPLHTLDRRETQLHRPLRAECFRRHSSQAQPPLCRASRGWRCRYPRRLTEILDFLRSDVGAVSS